VETVMKTKALNDPAARVAVILIGTVRPWTWPFHSVPLLHARLFAEKESRFSQLRHNLDRVRPGASFG
jgi:hypothetical protein